MLAITSLDRLRSGGCPEERGDGLAAGQGPCVVLTGIFLASSAT